MIQIIVTIWFISTQTWACSQIFGLISPRTMYLKNEACGVAFVYVAVIDIVLKLWHSDVEYYDYSLRPCAFSFFQDGKFREALGKWETALTLMPENAVLHEQKAQVLLEVGETWGALKAATSMFFSITF